jgi:hypothetical protein
MNWTMKGILMATDPGTTGGSRPQRKRAWALGCLLLANLAAPVAANATDYNTLVTSSEGPLAGTLLELTTIRISYTLDESVQDPVVSPDRGVFAGALLELSLEIPGIRAEVNAGPPGRASTFDNFAEETGERADEFSLTTEGSVAAVGLPDGHTLSRVEVLFFSDFVTPPAEPSMLDGDALPITKLQFNEGVLILEDDSGGRTLVRFVQTDSVQDSGCAIGSSDRPAPAAGWLVLLPALLLWRRQRQA